MKRTILFIATVILCTAEAGAQSKLDNLQFDLPQHIIRPKTEWSNIRKQPNTSAAVTKKASRTGSDIVTQMIAAKDHNAQWYQVDGGYAFKTAFLEAKKGALTEEMFLPNFYSYCEDMDCIVEWFVADKVGAHDLALMVVGDHCDMSTGGLYLGKRIGNVIVFRYRLSNFYINYQEEFEPNYINLSKQEVNGTPETTLNVGKNFMIKGVFDEGFNDYIYRPNLYKFNDKVIEKLFGEVLDKGPNVEFYLTSESFPADMKNISNF